METETFVNDKDKKDMENLYFLFKRPICSENVFTLINRLNLANQSAVDDIFKLFIESLHESNKSNRVRSPELLASQGIYLCIILRYNPSRDIYIENEHFLIIAYKSYYPYVSIFIGCFLVPCILSKMSIESPWNIGQIYEKEMPLATSPAANKLRVKVGSKPILNELERDSDNNSYDKKTHRFSESVINKMIQLCPLNSKEREIFIQIKNANGTGNNYFINKIGLKSQKSDMAIFLDMPSLVDDIPNDSFISKAIFVHSNKVLNRKTQYMPHHFNRAVECLNYDVCKRTFSLSDYVSDETLDNLTRSCKELKHAICLEILMMTLSKNITICRHHLKRIPDDWKEQLLETYTTPRWKTSIKLTQMLHANDRYNEMNDETFDMNNQNSTLEYYRLNLCSSSSNSLLAVELEELSTKLNNEENLNNFIENLRSMNKACYMLEGSSYKDLMSDRKITFGNVHDAYLHDIFEISKNFVFPCRQDGKIFLFDYAAVPSLINSKQNPYDRSLLSDKAFDNMTSKHKQYRSLGLSDKCSTMSEFISELIHGRSVEDDCSCGKGKNYLKKLTRLLKQYGIKEEHMEFINVSDALFKFSLISIDINISNENNIRDLCKELYMKIKHCDPSQKESLKENISSVLLVYVKYANSEMFFSF